MAGLALRRAYAESPVDDPLCGFRAYRAVVVKKALRVVGDSPLLRRDGWAANAELMKVLTPFTRRIAEAPPGTALRYPVAGFPREAVSDGERSAPGVEGRSSGCRQCRGGVMRRWGFALAVVLCTPLTGWSQDHIPIGLDSLAAPINPWTSYPSARARTFATSEGRLVLGGRGNDDGPSDRDGERTSHLLAEWHIKGGVPSGPWTPTSARGWTPRPWCLAVS